MERIFSDDKMHEYSSIPNDDNFFLIWDFNNNGQDIIVETNVERYLFWQQLEEKANQMIGN